MTRLLSTPEAWLYIQYNDEELREIAEHGCANCAPNGLTYYSETTAFYREHEGELLEVLEGFVRDCYGEKATVWEVFGKEAGTLEQLQNALVWAFVELVAQNASEG